MPSISEPFGITPLEAMMHGTPTIISKQSGVSEVVSHCLKVDFWDIDEMANKIISILNYKGLTETIRDNGFHEVQKFDWRIPAQKCAEVYSSVLASQGVRR
jgi:glycosyltransferase involved in cell wall biosynthesis